MTNVLQEVTEPQVTRDHVVRRVDDWVDRIESLYEDVESWLPEGWSTRRSRNTQMHEELMRKFGVDPRKLPILDLIHDGRIEASIEPRGLWIIGANGRLDLTRNGERFLITDASDNFNAPSWRISSFSNRQTSETFDCSKLQSIL